MRYQWRAVSRHRTRVIRQNDQSAPFENIWTLLLSAANSGPSFIRAAGKSVPVQSFVLQVSAGLQLRRFATLQRCASLSTCRYRVVSDHCSPALLCAAPSRVAWSESNDSRTTGRGVNKAIPAQFMVSDRLAHFAWLSSCCDCLCCAACLSAVSLCRLVPSRKSPHTEKTE